MADWLEIQALLSATRRISRSSLDSIIRLTVEERLLRRQVNAISGDREDGEIVDSFSEDLAAKVLAELDWRSNTLGQSYPFRLERGVKNADWFLLGPSDEIEPSATVYLACLTIVGYRRSLIDPDPSEQHSFTDHNIGLMFQICACLAVGGYVQGEVVSFGWPRSDKSAFLAALQGAWRRFGSYRIVERAPPGTAINGKDGGIDVIAWRHFSDARPSNLLLFGQSASGDNWVDKPVSHFVSALLSAWFSGHRPSHYIPATIIPFVAHEDLQYKAVWNDEHPVIGAMQHYEHIHGIVFDRIRVVSSAHRALTLPSAERAIIDGADRVGELWEWLKTALNLTKLEMRDVVS